MKLKNCDFLLTSAIIEKVILTCVDLAFKYSLEPEDVPEDMSELFDIDNLFDIEFLVME